MYLIVNRYCRHESGIAVRVSPALEYVCDGRIYLLVLQRAKHKSPLLGAAAHGDKHAVPYDAALLLQYACCAQTNEKAP